ncbi:DUF3014 domain-containing protein [Azoarcus indigens]|uniref:DUF3014 family protein n=1 Tax=Azoarcus indigens TaxID=29545 RepID=A0A4R6EFG6_9RHOO|nr:DUF3014 domain-containing protein [Azoarcus indigens]TDN56249.1 hypothetical protein C7389_102185 [Azoarcus indigens]
MNSVLGRVVTVAVVAAVAALGYFYLSREEARAPESTPVAAPNPEPAPAPVQGPQASGEIEPAIRHPIESAGAEVADASAPPPPALPESDALVADALASLIADTGLRDMVVVQDFIRRIVVTVDNLPGEQLPLSRSPVKPAAGAFMVSTEPDGTFISPENAARYRPFVALAEAVDSRRLVALYVRLYPLFQSVYEELGYPNAYFNDRLVTVLDHLLAAPEVTRPIRLVQPKVRYRFEDARLEALSAGQKIMIRIGPDNARRLKAKLREIRALVAGQAPNN